MLTKEPFGPLRKASVKHLTFKAVLLLAVASGKSRSEIHAWLPKVSKVDNWNKIAIVSLVKFIAKNQFAKKGYDSVAPVVIPALAPSLHEDLADDRTLCPVRALRYYLKATEKAKNYSLSPSTGAKTTDIQPLTISSRLKQTI